MTRAGGLRNVANILSAYKIRLKIKVEKSFASLNCHSFDLNIGNTYIY